MKLESKAVGLEVAGAKPVTVLFLESSLRMGGTETVLSRLMERLDRSRVRPILCCLYEPGILGERLLRKGYPVLHNLASGRLDLALPAKLARLLLQERVDVLFMVNQPIVQFWGTWASLLARVPVRVAAIRSTGKINRIQRRLWVNRLTFPWTTRVTALSATHKAYLVSKEGIDPRKIEIIPNGVDVEAFRANGSASVLRDSFRLPHGAPVVAIVAMLRPEKDHATFLRAAAEVRRRVSDAHFLLVGEGAERSPLEALTRELGLEACVHFTGVRDDIPQVLGVSDLCALSSRPVVETLSNAVLEYMAAGKPVVATRVGSLPEQVEEGVTGFLVEPGDWREMAERMVRLLADRSLARRMGEAGRRKVTDEYSIEHMVREWEALFVRLTAPEGARLPCA